MLAPYAVGSYQQVAAALPHKTNRPLLWAVAGTLVLGLMVGLGLTAYLGNRPVPLPPECTGGPCAPPAPPVSPVVGSPKAYRSTALGYALEYNDSPFGEDLPSQQQPRLARSDDTSIGWTFQSFAYSFRGEAAAGLSPQRIVDDIKQSKYPDATLAYTVSQAQLGYTVGYGNVYNLTLRTSTGASANGRLLLIAATKGDLAVVLEGLGPRDKPPGPGQSTGHPNPFAIRGVRLADTIANTVTWPGEPPL